ncbi:hypothetical protein B0I35DRAFT_170829 [Stachybotrys elegans]|uniref:Uncharacterized protein n=1 Tax=Stachybotrys elegans TaxID=80388 RepID=A0A8K0SXX3_9HYPO|nr:hypothetical protein B0I35DRAFT_170829 [Stachybotrys elegans]
MRISRIPMGGTRETGVGIFVVSAGALLSRIERCLFAAVAFRDVGATDEGFEFPVYTLWSGGTSVLQQPMNRARRCAWSLLACSAVCWGSGGILSIGMGAHKTPFVVVFLLVSVLPRIIYFPVSGITPAARFMRIA